MKCSQASKSVPGSLRLKRGNGAASAAIVSLSAAMLLPIAAQAQEAEQLETVKVQDTAIDPNPNAQVGVPYKARTSGDERRTRPLAETPATIQVLTSKAIEDSLVVLHDFLGRGRRRQDAACLRDDGNVDPLLLDGRHLRHRGEAFFRKRGDHAQVSRTDLLAGLLRLDHHHLHVAAEQVR